MESTYCECGYPTGPSKLLNQIVSLIECDVTQNDTPRIIDMLCCYVKNARNGFTIEDLPNIMTLLEILSERLKEESVFGDLLKVLLEICKIPIYLTQSSDVLRFAIDLQEYFSVLGYVLLRVEDIDFQKLALDTIVTLLEVRNEKHKNQISLEKRRLAAISGRFPEILSQIIFFVNDEIFPDILNLTFNLMTEFSGISKIMTEEDVLNSLLIRLEDGWRTRDLVTPDCNLPDTPPSFKNLRMIASIINLAVIYLQTHMDHLQNVPTVTRFSLWNLRYVFVHLSKSRNTSARNLILTCIVWLVDLFPESDFIPSGLAHDFLYSSCEASEEFITDIILIRNNAVVPVDDYMFLKLFICFIPTYLSFTGGKTILERNRVMYRLLKVFTYPPSNPKEHACVIKILSFKVLKLLIPHLEDEFIENSGTAILLKNIKQTGLSESGLILLTKCLETLRKTLQSDSRKVILNSIIFNDGRSTLIDLGRELLKFDIFSEKAQLCIQEIFHILSTVSIDCQNDAVAIDLAVGFLKRLLKQTPDEPMYDNRIVIAIMDFLWEVILQDGFQLEQFFKLEGVFVMLDVLQVYPRSIQIVTLGALVDLCDYSDGKSIPYMITWKGKNGVTLMPLLMDIFRKESKDLGVETGPHGEISDGRYPLMGKDQYDLTFKQHNVDDNPAITDMYASCRPKIYALLCMIFDRYENVYELANETYKTCNEPLQTEDQITLLLAENFLGLKFGEVWKELKVQFDVMSFEPLPSDRIVLDSLVERTHKWGDHLKEVQQDLLKAQLVDNLVDEQNTYRTLNDARITQALESINEAKYLARCTERMFRIAQTYKQASQVEKFMEQRNAPNVHQTFPKSLRVTPVFNQFITINEEVSYNDITYKLVSPIESETAENHEEASNSSVLNTLK